MKEKESKPRSEKQRDEELCIMRQSQIISL